MKICLLCEKIVEKNRPLCDECWRKIDERKQRRIRLSLALNEEYYKIKELVTYDIT